MFRRYLNAFADGKGNGATASEETEADLVKAKDQAFEDWRNLKVYSGGGSPHEAERRYYAAKAKLDAFRPKRS